MSDKKLTIKERLSFTLNYIKNFLFIIVPLTTFLGYITVLVVKDTEVYKRVNAVVLWHEESEGSFEKIEDMITWYESKSNSFAVGIRVNKVKNENGKIVYKTVYKATNGETYKAFYNEALGAYFYSDDNGTLKECH